MQINNVHVANNGKTIAKKSNQHAKLNRDTFKLCFDPFVK